MFRDFGVQVKPSTEVLNMFECCTDLPSRVGEVKMSFWRWGQEVFFGDERSRGLTWKMHCLILTCFNYLQDLEMYVNEI